MAGAWRHGATRSPRTRRWLWATLLGVGVVGAVTTPAPAAWGVPPLGTPLQPSLPVNATSAQIIGFVNSVVMPE